MADRKNNLSLLNNKKVKVSQRREKKEAIIGLTKQNLNYENVVITKSNLQNLCYLGMGKYDAVIIDEKTSLLDLGLLFIKIAGGTIKEKDEKFIVSNGVIEI